VEEDEIATKKLKEAKEKNKERFDKKTSLAPKTYSKW